MPSALSPAWRFIAPVAILTFVGLGGYLTRSTWMPYVLPEKPAAKVEKREEAGAPNRIKLSPQAQTNLKLIVKPLIPEPYMRHLMIPGVVVDRPGVSERGVIAPLAGVVTTIHVQPGDTVKPDEPLFTIRVVSELLQTTQSALFKTTGELKSTEENLARLRAAPAGTIVESRIIEVENQVKREAATISAYRQELAARGLTGAHIDAAAGGTFLKEIIVRAPAAATVDVARNITSTPEEPVPFEVDDLKVQAGQAVESGQLLCQLSHHQSLFVEGHAFKSEAKSLALAAKEGWPVRAEFAEETPGEWGVPDSLIVRHLANTLNAETRTLSFYLPLRNQGERYVKEGKTYFTWRYRPGQRVRLLVPVAKLEDDVFILPTAAVVREGPEAFVFRQNGDFFERKAVTVLYEGRTEMVIKNDGSIWPGHYVARNQAAALNRAIKAAAGGSGGGHEGHDHAH